MVIYPEPLKESATLAAISPAGPVDPEEFERGCVEISRFGYRIVRLPSAGRTGSYLAGDDPARAKDVMDAFCDDHFNGVICTRGGYGSMRILPLLDFNQLVQHPKFFVGFSDISALQWALWKQTRLVTFSGPQLAKGWGGGLTEFSRSCWLKAARGEIWDSPLPFPEEAGDLRAKLYVHRPGSAEGRLLGGNLAVLASLAGTPFAPQFADAILLLEEIDEPPYRIDRMLTQLVFSGALKGVRGVVLGRFLQHTEEGEKEWSSLAASLLASALPGAPILTGAPYGHVEDCWTVPLGAWASVNAKGSSLVLQRI